MRPLLSPEEYRLLSDQKAQDFRAFLQLNPALLAVTGAIFAAGFDRHSSIAVALSTLPMLLAVLQLVRNAELQLQMTTYLAVFGPEEEGRWERDIAQVRPVYWQEFGPRFAIFRPSGWNIWILAWIAISEILFGLPWITGFDKGLPTFIVSTCINIAPSVYLIRTSSRIQQVRKHWEDLWREYRDDKLTRAIG